MYSISAYQDVMAECDELTLLTKRVPYVIQAQVSDVKDNMTCIEQMKIQAAQLRLELDRLLQESEIRLQVASVNSLPPCEVLQSYENCVTLLEFVSNNGFLWFASPP